MKMVMRMKQKMKNSCIILLSGGLDCVVSLALVREICTDILALTFNYGQKSFETEKKASSEIAEFYGIEHKIIDLPWLSDISTSSLNTSDEVPSVDMKNLDNIEITAKTSNSVWVPNRNGLFANIGATYAEALNYNSVVIGANKEEAQTFRDNTKEFVAAINKSFENSLNKTVMFIAPLIDSSKDEIVKMGLELKVPFELIHSCYLNSEKHCGKCESCVRLKRALENNGANDIIEKIF